MHVADLKDVKYVSSAQSEAITGIINSPQNGTSL